MNRFLIILVCFLVCACHKDQSISERNLGVHERNDETDLNIEDQDIATPRTSKPPATAENSLTRGSKIIKTGNLSFEVSKLEKSKSRIDSLVKSVDAYFENELFKSRGNRNSYVMKVRIPTANFDTFVKQLESGTGELKSKNIHADDVTEEYMDLHIRLENNLAYLLQYQEILKKAVSIKEILEVQEMIRGIEIEIESKKGRIRYLTDMVKYSTLDVEISELIAKELAYHASFGKRISNSFNSGVKGLLGFIVGMVSIWPMILFGGISYAVRKPIFRLIQR